MTNSESTATVVDSFFSGNFATASGGGMGNLSNSGMGPIVINSRFEDNTTGEHGAGMQFFRPKAWPAVFPLPVVIVAALALLAIGALANGAWIAGAGLCLMALGLGLTVWSALAAAAAIVKESCLPEFCAEG